MAIIATVRLLDGYSPREAVKLHWVWPEDSERRAENVVAIMIEIADDLPLDDGETFVLED